MAVPAGASGGRVLRLRGKGLPASGELPQGDLLATLRIAMPAGEDAELAKLMRRWRDEKPYDPRSGMAG
jgi:DnaJ-class molecular chaperone